MFPLILNSSGVTNEDEQLLVSQHKWHYMLHLLDQLFHWFPYFNWSVIDLHRTSFFL